MGVCGGAVPAGGKILKSQLALDLLHKMTVELIFFTAAVYSRAVAAAVHWRPIEVQKF